jgi:Leucine-rich repeat (LRR) protein
VLNASFCGVDEITGEQAVELQDRNILLQGNPVTEITWTFQNLLTKIPAWLRTLEKVAYADLTYCNVKEMKGGAFPASLEVLHVDRQVSGLRLHPDSFEELSRLRELRASNNKLTEDDMHPGLFGDTKLEWLDVQVNEDMLNFDAAALFPGSSGQQLEYLHLQGCGLTGIGGGYGTNFAGLSALGRVYLMGNEIFNNITADAFAGLEALNRLDLEDAKLTSLPANVFAGECAARETARQGEQG